ncbi:MAG: protein-glutamate O-methyltransferase [Ferruginibacter sp.]|nr:protein-glutamate O-methyltransferase [Cytophagales bacterium]
MSTQDFSRLSQFIYVQYGIKMSPLKKTMLEGRLQKRLSVLNLASYRHYCDYLFSAEGQARELIPLINTVTTNKTDFFREATHFDFLTNHVLPEFDSAARTNGNPLRVWSAGCSTGEEPYTLAMVMNEFAATRSPSLSYLITGTDLSTRVLQHAANAVYAEERTAAIPLILKRKYFLRSKDADQQTVRIVPELRRRVTFQSLNFMDHHYEVPGSFDVVFCRNVLIYFDRPTQEKVINRLCAKLKPGGYFFLGHSESVTDMQVPIQQIRPTIFRKV